MALATFILIITWGFLDEEWIRLDNSLKSSNVHRSRDASENHILPWKRCKYFSPNYLNKISSSPCGRQHSYPSTSMMMTLSGNQKSRWKCMDIIIRQSLRWHEHQSIRIKSVQLSWSYRRHLQENWWFNLCHREWWGMASLNEAIRWW